MHNFLRRSVPHSCKYDMHGNAFARTSYTPASQLIQVLHTVWY